MSAEREAWRRKFAREPNPWRGPVHAAPLLRGLAGRVVELGAGGGKVGAALPPDALALDWAALPPGRPALYADARALPFAPGSLDALVAIHVLGHLDDARAALAEWRRALRTGGTLVLETFARGDAREEGTTSEGITTRHFDRDELRALLAEAGFEGALELEERRARWGVRRALRGRLFAR